MQRSVQPESLVIKHLEINHWPASDRLADCYELILIQTGEGDHTVNENRFAYHPGDAFFLGAKDQYSFSVRQRTSCYWLSFSPVFASSLMTTGNQSWGYLNHPASPCVGSITANSVDQSKLQVIAALLLSEERVRRSLIDNPIIEGLMQTLLSLINRLFDQRGITVTNPNSHSADISRQVIAYITRHIGEPHRLRMDIIADAFHYSPSHLSALFKQQVGNSIQHFIIQHKLRLVATRLRQTSLSVSQIADEFGFSDVCHLNKLFKRHYNYTPTTYRQGLFA